MVSMQTVAEKLVIHKDLYLKV